MNKIEIERLVKDKRTWIIGIGILALILIVVLVLTLKPGKKQEEPRQEGNTDTPKENTVQIVDLNSNSRPIAVMINNHDKAVPNHSGLQDAYLVYEMIVEGGLTRLMALFRDQNTAKIGSVRSSRHYYLDYVLENDAIYTHFGWSPQAEEDIASLGINNINGLYDSGFFRDNSLDVPYEHRAFTSMEGILANIKKKNYRTTTDSLLFSYQVEKLDLSKVEGVQVANNVEIVYSSSQKTGYVYDQEKGAYVRYVDGKIHTDGVTKKPYTVRNIITYQVKNSSIDSHGRQTLDNLGTGKGYYITDGYAVPITWEKANRSSKTIYRYLNGEELVLNDGNTFIQIQPTGQKLTISE